MADLGVNNPAQGLSFDRQMGSVQPGLQTGVARITIGPTIPADAFSEVADDAPYDLYQVEVHAVWDTGNVQMPGTGIGAAGTDAAVVRAHGGMLKLLAVWVVGRTGAPPVLPAFLTANDGMVPLRAVVVGSEVVPSADGTDVTYLCSGYYEYAILYPSLFQMVGITPPMFGAEVGAAAKLGYTAWADLLNVTGVAGANPFVTGGTAAGNLFPLPSPAFNQPAPAVVNTPSGSQNQPGGGGAAPGPVINA